MRDAIEEQRETIGKELFEQVVGIATKVCAPMIKLVFVLVIVSSNA